MLKNENITKKRVLMAIPLIIVLLGGTALGYKKYINPTEQVGGSGTYEVKDVPEVTPDEAVDEKAQDDTATNGQTTTPEEAKSTNLNNSSVNLTAPYGNFVSNHSPSRNDNIESVCLTSPGAKCKIVFTMGNVQKSLNPKATNSQGVTAWVWKPRDIGILGGSWDIKAVATLGGKSKTTKDAMKLKVH
jgi:hypothetical protein